MDIERGIRRRRHLILTLVIGAITVPMTRATVVVSSLPGVLAWPCSVVIGLIAAYVGVLAIAYTDS